MEREEQDDERRGRRPGCGQLIGERHRSRRIRPALPQPRRRYSRRRGPLRVPGQGALPARTGSRSPRGGSRRRRRGGARGRRGARRPRRREGAGAHRRPRQGGRRQARRRPGRRRARRRGEILGLDIRGHVVRNGSGSSRPREIAQEYYLSVTFDRGARRPLLMFTTRGRRRDRAGRGRAAPTRSSRLHVDPLEGFQPSIARASSSTARARATRASRSRSRAIVEQLYRVLRRERRDALRDQPADRHARRAR